MLRVHDRDTALSAAAGKALTHIRIELTGMQLGKNSISRSNCSKGWWRKLE